MPTPSQLARAKELLAQKIDTKEKFDAVLATLESIDCAHDRSFFADFCMSGIRGTQRDLNGTQWWVHRQVLRMNYLYEPLSSTLFERLCELGLTRYLPHVSTEDGQQVAYTTSPEDGVRDKATRSTFGRFVRRFNILLTDRVVQELEQMWRAERDPTFNIARTVEEVTYVYTHMAGDSGCMRYSATNWRGNKGHHPSEIYTSPGFGVAYLGEMNGTIIARAVIYENPNDENDKRYVRLYGAPQLRTKLERAGYRCAGLGGTEVKAISLGNERFVMPYVDPAAGARSSEDGSAAIRDAAKPDVIRLLTPDERNMLRAYDGVYTANTRTTEGCVYLPATDLSSLSFYCHFDNVQYGPFDRKLKVYFLTADGYKTVSRSAIESHDVTGVLGKHRDPTYALTSELEELTYEVIGYHTRLSKFDTEDCMGRHRVFRLAPSRYGENKFARAMSVIADVATDEYILLSDSVRIYKDGEIRSTHKDAVEGKTGRNGEYVALTFEGRPLYVVSDDPNLVRTISGRRAVIGLHDITKLIDGTWSFSRNVTSDYWMGRVIYRVAGSQLTSEMFSDEMIAEAVRANHRAVTSDLPSSALNTAAQQLRDIIRAAYYSPSRQVVTLHTDGNPMLSGRYPSADYDSALAAMTEGADAVDAKLAAGEEVDAAMVFTTKMFRRVLAVVQAKLDEIAAILAARDAGAPAVEQGDSTSTSQAIADIRRQLEATLAA